MSFRDPRVLGLAQILYKTDRDAQMGIRHKPTKPEMTVNEPKTPEEEPLRIPLYVGDDLEVVEGEVSSQTSKEGQKTIDWLWRLLRRMTPDNFVKEQHVALNAEGKPVHSTDPRAVKWNLIGHIQAMASDASEAEYIFQEFEDLHDAQCDEDRHWGRSRYFGATFEAARAKVGAVIHLLQNPYYYN